jgi:enoyl-CoA hydratase/carnithine racemase
VSSHSHGTSFTTENVHLELDGKIAWLTLTRERYLNAVNRRCVRDLKRAFLAIASDSAVRVAVVTGRGRAFSTGIDLKELSTSEFDISYFVEWEEALRVAEQMEKIVIAGLHGYCLGGGLQLALACDIRLSTRDCRIGLPAVKEALIPGLAPWRLSRYAGMGRAKWLVLSGEDISGDQAVQFGLVDGLIEEDCFHQALEEAAQGYLGTCSVATRYSKQLLNTGYDDDYEMALRRYLEAQERAHYSVDGAEARQAYRDGRKPEWH